MRTCLALVEPCPEANRARCRPGRSFSPLRLRFGAPVLGLGVVVSLTKLSRFLSLSAAGIGALCLTGWIFDVPILTRLNPSWVTMKANMAISLMPLGIGTIPSLYPQAPVGACLLMMISARFVAGMNLPRPSIHRSFWTGGTYLEAAWIHADPGGKTGAPGDDPLKRIYTGNWTNWRRYFSCGPNGQAPTFFAND